LGRIGGEEFMLIMPRTSLAQAERVVGTILMKVREARPIQAVPSFSYTCSAGIADVRPGEIVSELYARADRALYRAKHAGRDRLEIAA
jgi:diguanylate cyclase (GGDEF)-like protein